MCGIITIKSPGLLMHDNSKIKNKQINGKSD
jgi:hypothetical protein